MPPEQLEKTPEEIVQRTGWGFLISGSTKPPAPDLKDLKQKDQLVSLDNAPPSPPPAVDH